MRRLIFIWLTLILILCGCSQMPLLTGMINASSEDDANNADLRDDFSDKKSGWEEIISSEGSAGYSNGAYQIRVTYPNTDIFTTFTKTFVNSDVVVIAARTAGTDDNNFGVICRYQDPKNFYAGQISSDGTAGIFKIENGTYQLLGNKHMLPIPVILDGNSENEIRFECIEKTLTLSVNGALADSQEDDTFKSGEIGLIAGVLGGDSGVFQFDDLTAIAR